MLLYDLLAMSYTDLHSAEAVRSQEGLTLAGYVCPLPFKELHDDLTAPTVRVTVLVPSNTPCRASRRYGHRWQSEGDGHHRHNDEGEEEEEEEEEERKKEKKKERKKERWKRERRRSRRNKRK